jgi:hypothetical protein
MQDLPHWLEELGMSEYMQRFVENRVDFSVLPDLTDQDLEKLGVLLGDRLPLARGRCGGRTLSPLRVPAESCQTDRRAYGPARERQSGSGGTYAVPVLAKTNDYWIGFRP